MTTSPSQPLKIAITGGDGLIGTAVISHALFEGHTVVALDRSPKPREPHAERYTYHSVDLTDYEAFKTAVEGCDSIVHLAAIYNKHDGKGNSIDEGPQHVSYSLHWSRKWTWGTVKIDCSREGRC